jgi:hypothetical protein
MLKISAYGNDKKNLSINHLAYPMDCKVSGAHGVFGKQYITVVDAGDANADFSILNRGLDVLRLHHTHALVVPL